MSDVDAAVLIVSAPVAGRTTGLDEVPDPVFGERMMGDGIAIHPLGDTICAPFDGTVATLHESAHAVAIRSDEGAELLVHVGLDTVALDGRGFTALARIGDRVTRGTPLIRVDLDAVGLAATSLVTPIIVTNGDAFAITSRAVGSSVACGDELMGLVLKDGASRTLAPLGGAVTKTVRLGLPHGIHARPAARLGDALRDLNAEVALLHAGKRADLRSSIAVLSLGTRLGDEVTIEAHGPDAAAAVHVLVELLGSSMGEAARSPAAQPVQSLDLAQLEDGQHRGIVASPGLVMGPAWHFRRQAAAATTASFRGVEIEQAALAKARAAVRSEIEQLTARSESIVAGVMKAHLALLDDPALLAAADTVLHSGMGAATAWQQATAAQVAAIRASGNAHMAERAADLQDIEQKVVAALSGTSLTAELPRKGAILVADDLLPSQLIALADGGVAGVCLEQGGPTSHVAILCAGLGIPALVALGSATSLIANGATLLLDADAGLLTVDPAPERSQAFAAAVAGRQRRREAARAASSELCRTADGHRIHFYANVGSAEDAVTAAAEGAEGSGLVRSEFLFLDRADAPSEEEQLRAYQGIAEALSGRPVLVRLLDIGGDKPAAYIPIPHEENPALGLRGIRIGLANRALLQSQINAILRVQPIGQCRIMIPMVASLDEIRQVRAMVDAARMQLGIAERVDVGIMVETPAAAMTADLLAEEADFLSIGSNDLTQYVLAMDRGNAAVAAGIDGLHPAVLRMIHETCRLAKAKGRWVGLCGGLASDPIALPILIGLGLDELSAVPSFVAEGKDIVRRSSMEAAAELAAQALRCSSAGEVRTLARAFASAPR